MNVLESVSQYKDRISAELDNTLTETELNSVPNKKGKVISTNKFKNEIIPSFTKKLFRVASSHQWKK